MMDRSISALRTLRPDQDGSIFWFRDDLHQPNPMSPMGMTTVQKHHAWGYHVASEHTQLPPSKGAYVKIHKGRVYLGFTLIEDPDEVARRAEKFGKLLDYCRDHWDEFYNGYIEEVSSGLATLAAVDGDRLTTPHLLDLLRKAEEVNRRNWEIHFILMYPADTLYLEVEAFCKEHGLGEGDYIDLLKGFKGMPAKTDEELWGLARTAVDMGLRDVLTETPGMVARDVLASIPKAKDWLTRFENFLSTYGNRINAAHLDVLFPTWKEDPAPVFDTIKSYFRRMDEGWHLHNAREEVRAQRTRAVAAFEKRLKPADLEKFRGLLKIGQKVYAYQEDHGFYIDQGSTAALHDVLMACGRRLVKLGLTGSPDDVFFLTYHELVEILSDITRDEKVGVIHYGPLVPSLVAERREGWDQAPSLEAPLTVGNVPQTMTDPIAIKVFGIVDEILHPKGEATVSDHLEGFAASPGKVEGPARVVTRFEDFASVQSGEILVCPYTGTAWTPLFLKIAGVVTDTGGMLTHAAIAAREYGIPAVVGTWNATHSIRNGDIIRLDGAAGKVDVVQRIAAH